MLEVIIVAAIVLVLAAGFWWTRGAGGIPGGIDDPAFQQLRHLDKVGDPIELPREREDREHEVE